MLLQLISITIALIVTTIIYYKWKFSFWKRLGVPTSPPSIPFGNAKELLFGKQSIGEQSEADYKYYKKQNARHVGRYLLTTPNYTPIDLEIVKNILEKDFDHFTNHGSYINEKDDPLSGHLFNLKDTKWRNMRIKLTPTFTSGKLKMMFGILIRCAEVFKEVMDEYATSRLPVDIKEILGRFTTDIIGNIAFGLDCNTLKNCNSDFRNYGKMLIEPDFIDQLKLLASLILPHSILKLFRMKITKTEAEDFFMDIVKKTVDYREMNQNIRHDFLQLLIEIKNNPDDNQNNGVTMNELAAQAVVFFIAGFETSSTLMTFALFELAINYDIQEKLRAEIITISKKYNNELTYEAIMEMTYLDQIINESLRKYPPTPVIPRICTKDYQIPGTDIIIPKNTQVKIPVLGIHHDEEYYPDPLKFIPERFTEENKAKRPLFSFLPFGKGPRICIGFRLGLLQSKVGLAVLLKEYKVTLNGKTKVPLEYKKFGVILGVEGGVWLDITKIQNK